MTRSAHRRRCPHRSRGVRGGVHRPDVSQRLRAQLQYAAGLVAYVHRQLGLPIASTAPLAKITDAFSAAVHRFARDQRVPWVDFAKGQRKDDVMHEHLAGFTAEPRGCCSSARRRRRRRCSAPRNAATPRRQTLSLDRARPPGWSTSSTSTASTTTSARSSSSSAPTSPTTPSCASTATNTSSGNWPRKGSPSRRWTTAFAACRRPRRAAADLRRSRPRQDRRAAAQVAGRSCRIRSPPPDRAAGYRYDVSILQAEFSLTQVLDRPQTGRIFFEEVIRENLDLGRPDQVQLIFDRAIVAGRERRRAGSAPGCSPRA